MIDISQEELLGLLIRAMVSGVALGIFYDLLRIVRIALGVESRGRLCRNEKKKNILTWVFDIVTVFLLDLFFGVCVGVVSVLLIYHANKGIFRGMVYLGMLGGFLLYHLSVSRLVIKLSQIVIRFLKKVVRTIIRVLLVPVKALFRCLKFIYHLTIGKIIGKIITEVKAAQATRRERRMKKRSVSVGAAKTDADVQEYAAKGDWVYVNEKKIYKKEGRISFCKKDRSP